MERRKKAFSFLIIIFIVAILGAFFVMPKGFGAKALPWRLGLDLVGGSHLVYEVDMTSVAEADRSSVMNGLRDVIETRVNKFGVSEPQVYTARSGDSYRLVAELAGIKNVSDAIKEIGATPFLEFREAVEVPPPPTATTTEPQITFRPTALNGRFVQGAQLTFDQLNQPQISISFNSEGATLFENLTGANIGKPLGIFLDGEPISLPIVNEKISGGQAQISGQFTLDEARTLVERFNAGALPAPITLINQQTVDATLGNDSLVKTLWAGAIGTLLVILFMLIYYGRFGLFASIALLLYIIFILMASKLFSITMTLAGIAGIILSIGMAVDANILIFERSNEEVKKGVKKHTAIEEGFKRAWLSIRDSNITTIITSIILYFFTTGFIKGFALSLLIGVLISMFSAITVTRNLLRAFVKDTN